MEKKEYGSWTVEGGCWEKQRREGEKGDTLTSTQNMLGEGSGKYENS